MSAAALYFGAALHRAHAVLQQRLDEANAKLAALGAGTSLVASNTSGENVSEV